MRVVAALLSAATAVAQTCDDATLDAQLFVAHWSHVPKAGGTALAGLARRIVCAKNPFLGTTERHGALNPCCVPNFCADARTCEATATTCPLVLGIGRHETSMARLLDITCCADEWFQATVGAFMMYAVKPSKPLTPTAWDLKQAGITKDGEKITIQPIAAKKEKNLLWRWRALRGHYTWPMERRIEFFAATGVPRKDLEARIRKHFSRDPRLKRLLAAAAKAPTTLVSRPEQMETCHRAAHGTWRDVAATFSPYADFASPEQAKKDRPCCGRRPPGAASMTMLREPFRRAASAFHYPGHNPNQDHIYRIRPGVFYDARRRPGRDGPRYTFLQFVRLEEYRNIMTKLFGDFSCPRAARCLQVSRRRNREAINRERGCSLVAICHAYRNATLRQEHVARAKAALDRHAFVGLTEAYSTSVKLALATFGVAAASDGSDYHAARAGRGSRLKCSGKAGLEADGAKCRVAFAQNELDYEVYEHAHRGFCRRLAERGLMADPAVQAELGRSSLCGALNFSRVDDVCGRLETDEAVAKRAKLCDGQG